MDVDGLCTNIPIDEGIECIERAFLKHPDSRTPDKELIELLN